MAKPKPAEQLRKILARLRGVPAAGEHTLKTWGREIGQTLTQVEDLLEPEVAAGRVTREQRRDGTYLYRAVRLEAPVEEAVEEPAPAPVEEPAAVAAVVAAVVEEMAAPEAPSPEDEFKPEPEASPAPPPAPVAPLALLPADLSEDQLQALLAAKKRHARAVESLSAAQAELEAAQAAWMAALAGQVPPRGPAKAPATTTTDEAMQLGPSAAKIVSYLRNASGSVDVDAILRGTGLERSSLSALLSTLTQRGVIRRVGRGLYMQGVA